MRRLLGIGLLLFAFSVPGASAGAPAGASWLAPVGISSPIPSTYYGLRVGLADNGDAVAAWGESGVKAAIRLAGGRWQPPQALSSAGEDAGFPDLALGRNGNAVAVWQSSEGTHSVVRVALRATGGRFRSPLDLAEAGEKSVVGESPPKVAVDGRGRAVVVWATRMVLPDGSYGNPIVQVAEGSLRGGFGALRDLAPGDAPDLAVNAKGEAIVAWAGPGGIEAVVRPAGGHFGTPQQLGSGGQYPGPRVALDAGGKALVAWGVENGGGGAVEAAYRPTGKRFGPTELVGGATFGVAGLAAGLGPRGHAIVLWSSDRNTSFPLQAASGAIGRRFFSAQLLSPDTSGFALGISPQGEAVAVWSRFAGDYLLQAAMRAPGSIRFAPAHDLSEPGYNALEPDVAVDAVGDALAAWERSQGRNFFIQAAGYDATGPQLRRLRVPHTGRAGTSLAFSVAPFDVWSRVASTRWRFGDGTAAKGASVMHAYRRPGRYAVTVTATDVLGHATRSTLTVRIRSRGRSR